jgi:hypothetical protein
MIHNTFLNRVFNELIETNALNPAYLSIGNQGIATIQLQPYIDVVRTSQEIGGNGTMYTTPTDKDFYLTNFHLTCYGDGVSTQGTATLQFVTRDNHTIVQQLATSATGMDSNATSVIFPMRGVLLAKGSTITSSVVNGVILIAGYVGSGRSL